MGSEGVRWIVCGHETRSVEGRRVMCPLRGPIASSRCLACRLMVTSSLERQAGWCEIPDAPAVALRPVRQVDRPRQVPALSARAPRQRPGMRVLVPRRRSRRLELVAG